MAFARRTEEGLEQLPVLDPKMQLLCFRSMRNGVCLFVCFWSASLKCRIPDLNILSYHHLFSRWAGVGRSLQSCLDSALGHEYHSFAWQVFARRLAPGRNSARVPRSKVDTGVSATGMCWSLPSAAHCFCDIGRRS